MSLSFNGTEIESADFDGTELESISVDGVEVWTSFNPQIIKNGVIVNDIFGTQWNSPSGLEYGTLVKRDLNELHYEAEVDFSVLYQPAMGGWVDIPVGKYKGMHVKGTASSINDFDYSAILVSENGTVSNSTMKTLDINGTNFESTITFRNGYETSSVYLRARIDNAEGTAGALWFKIETLEFI